MLRGRASLSASPCVAQRACCCHTHVHDIQAHVFPTLRSHSIPREWYFKPTKQGNSRRCTYCQRKKRAPTSRPEYRNTPLLFPLTTSSTQRTACAYLWLVPLVQPVPHLLPPHAAMERFNLPRPFFAPSTTSIWFCSEHKVGVLGGGKAF